MKTLQITPLAKARVRFNERATTGFVSEGLIEASVRASDCGQMKFVSVAVEALVPRGARAAYGLIGVQYRCDARERLRCEVPYSGMTGSSWGDALAAQFDDVRLGLPKEYASAVVAALASAAEGRMASGVLSIVDAAHGLVGSSSEFFEKLTRAAVELALLSGGDVADDQVVSILRDILVG